MKRRLEWLVAAAGLFLALHANSFALGELPTASSFTNVSERECFIFAQGFCAELLSGELDPDRVLDTDALVLRSRDNSRQLTVARENFERSVKIAFSAAFPQRFGNVSSLRVLGVRADGKFFRVMVRMLLKSGGFSYMELLCQEHFTGVMRGTIEPPRDMQRSFQIADIFEYGTGEYMSDSMRRVANRLEDRLSKRLGKKQSDADIDQFNKSIMQQDWPTVVKIYHRLPENLQRDKTFATSWVRAASHVSAEEHLRALRFLQINFPRDPSIELITMDALTIQKKYDTAIEMVDRVDARVGGDPYLEIIRARLYKSLDKLEQEKEHLKEAFRREPELAQGTRMLASPAIKDLSKPTKNSEAQAGTASAARINSPKMRLQGVFIRSDHSSALISGQSLYEGDNIDGMQIVKIEKSRVTLQTPSGELRRLSFD